MITVKYNENQLKDTLSVTVTGHAKSAKKGEDIICASASILALTLAQTIKSMSEQGFLVNKPKIKLRDGFASVSCKPKKEYYTLVYNSLMTIKTGYYLLSETFSDYVNLIDVGSAQ